MLWDFAISNLYLQKISLIKSPAVILGPPAILFMHYFTMILCVSIVKYYPSYSIIKNLYGNNFCFEKLDWKTQLVYFLWMVFSGFLTKLLQQFKNKVILRSVPIAFEIIVYNNNEPASQSQLLSTSNHILTQDNLQVKDNSDRLIRQASMSNIDNKQEAKKDLDLNYRSN